MKRNQPSKRHEIEKTEDAEAELGPPPHIIAMLHSPRLPESIRRKYDDVRERCVERQLRTPSSIEHVTLPSGRVVKPDSPSYGKVIDRAEVGQRSAKTRIKITPDVPGAINYTGVSELTFTPAGGKWVITAYRVTTRRTSAAGTTTTTAKSGSTP